MLRFGVLGPLLVNLDGRPIELSTAMLRRLLAILLCQPGQPMPIDQLLEALWDGQPPPTARKTLQIYMHRLRRALGDGQVPRGPTGYWIALENAEVDSTLFAGLLREAGQANDRQELPEASRLYAMALEQWRGNAFADVIGCAHIANHARQLDEAHLHALERLADIEPSWLPKFARLRRRGRRFPPSCPWFHAASPAAAANLNSCKASWTPAFLPSTGAGQAERLYLGRGQRAQRHRHVFHALRRLCGSASDGRAGHCHAS